MNATMNTDTTSRLLNDRGDLSGQHARRHPAVTAIHDKFRARRQALSARRRLERDLAAYTSQRDLDDLHAMLDRYPDAAAEPVRRILERRRRQAA